MQAHHLCHVTQSLIEHLDSNSGASVTALYLLLLQPKVRQLFLVLTVQSFELLTVLF